MSLGRLILCSLVLTATAAAWAQPTEFDPYLTYPLDQEAQTVAAGDLNGDGRDDVAVTAWPSGVYVLYQNDEGTLSSPASLYAPNMPLGIAIGDVNGDGRADLAVGGANGLVFLYLQTSDGKLQLPAYYVAYGHINGLAISDLNGDGLGDLVGTTASYGLLFIGLNTTGTAFAAPAFHMLQGGNAHCASVLDYNSDGLKDVAVLLDDILCYLTQGSPGAFQVMDYWPAMWAHSLAAGDITGDGLDDLVYSVATNQPDAAIGVLAQTQWGYAVNAEVYPALDFAQALALADLDGDGRQDVVCAHNGYEALTVTHQTQDGTLGEYDSYSIPYCNWYNYGGLATGDFNSDGLPDIAIADWWNGLVVLTHARSADATPPVCSASVSGTLGNNGWYVSPVTVTLQAVDEGPSTILYTLDGANWAEYGTALSLWHDGLYQIGFYAKDAAGNSAQAQWLTIGIDSEAPTLTLTPSLTELWPPTGDLAQVPIAIGSEDALSGADYLHLSVIDEYGIISDEFDVADGEFNVSLIASRYDDDRDGRVYTLVLTGADAAGNVAKATSTVTVPHSKPQNPKKPDKPKNKGK